MPTPTELKAAFFYQANYHVVFKSIDGLLLFNKETDYQLFLDRFCSFTRDFIDVWAYILLQNHVHLIIKIKSPKAIEQAIQNFELFQQTVAMQKLATNIPDEKLLDAVIERQINSFMVSYTNSINNKAQRKGGFFQKPFKRILIADDSHLQQAIIYVHANAQKHQVINDFTRYRFSSYHEIIKGSSMYVKSKEIINFFDNKENFISKHQLQVAYYYSNGWASSKLE